MIIFRFQKKNHGFTLIEILVAMAVLVILFALVTVLYVRASRIQKSISVQNDVLDVISSIMNEIVNGQKGVQSGVGLINAANVISNQGDLAYPTPGTYPPATVGETMLVMSDETWKNTSIFRITTGNTGKETDLQRYDPQTVSWISLDTNKKILLLSGSRFEYLNNRGDKNISAFSETSLARITLTAKTSDPTMKNRPAVTVQTAVSLRKKK